MEWTALSTPDERDPRLVFVTEPNPWLVSLRLPLVLLHLSCWLESNNNNNKKKTPQEEMQSVQRPKRRSTSLEFEKANPNNNDTIFYRWAGKNLKRLATCKCWQGSEEVYCLPLLLEGVWIATVFGESLPAVFINNKNTHLLTIKKQSYFGDFILQK